jgi:hypothetical protein
MVLDPWVMNYKTRHWKKYELELGSPETPPRAPVEYQLMEYPIVAGVHLCLSSESDEAKSIKDQPNRFYWDEELVAADLDPIWDGNLDRLDREWRGHPAGKLVMQIFIGARQTPPGKIVTYLVEV